MLRGDADGLGRAWAHPGARVLRVRPGDGAAPRGVPPAGWVTDLAEVDGHPRLRTSAVGDDPAAEARAVRVLLGLDDEDIPWWALLDPDPDPDPDPGPGATGDGGTRAAGLLEAGADLDDRDAGALVAATGLAAWHAAHPCCSRCGTPTVVEQGGWVRRCPSDASQHFPRSDPAVIMLVHDGADRCLLGRQPSWPRGRLSCLAGFVEPGESLEQAVAREVAEEVGLRVRDARYVTSQPWPFPSSLMLAFLAEAEPAEPVLVDGELAEAHWVSREDLLAGVLRGEDGVPSRLRVPPPVSVAHRLITDWAGGEPAGRW